MRACSNPCTVAPSSATPDARALPHRRLAFASIPPFRRLPLKAPRSRVLQNLTFPRVALAVLASLLALAAVPIAHADGAVYYWGDFVTNGVERVGRYDVRAGTAAVLPLDSLQDGSGIDGVGAAPHGSAIAIAGAMDGSLNGVLYRFGPLGGVATPLRTGATTDDYAGITFSPDSAWIAFLSDLDLDGSFALYVVPAGRRRRDAGEPGAGELHPGHHRLRMGERLAHDRVQRGSGDEQREQPLDRRRDEPRRDAHGGRSRRRTRPARCDGVRLRHGRPRVLHLRLPADRPPPPLPCERGRLRSRTAAGDPARERWRRSGYRHPGVVARRHEDRVQRGRARSRTLAGLHDAGRRDGARPGLRRAGRVRRLRARSGTDRLESGSDPPRRRRRLESRRRRRCGRQLRLRAAGLRTRRGRPGAGRVDVDRRPATRIRVEHEPHRARRLRGEQRQRTVRGHGSGERRSEPRGRPHPVGSGRRRRPRLHRGAAPRRTARTGDRLDHGRRQRPGQAGEPGVEGKRAGRGRQPAAGHAVRDLPPDRRGAGAGGLAGRADAGAPGRAWDGAGRRAARRLALRDVGAGVRRGAIRGGGAHAQGLHRQRRPVLDRLHGACRDDAARAVRRLGCR